MPPALGKILNTQYIMAKGFGSTWWGQRWLDSLSHIDYENRIPRGAAYARAGAVKSLNINGNIVTAKVAGHRPRPYTVTLVIPPFFQEDIDRLVNGILMRPDIVSKLLKHDLDPAVLDIARDCGLKIFPEKWTDFKMQCNCPDWAVPCKHLAAVIYMMSREIDNNPFVVFRIHNVDLPAELKKRGLDVEQAAKTSEVPLLKDVLQLCRPVAGTGQPEFRRIDFSHLSDRLDVLLMLLPRDPAFDTGGDFKEQFSLQMRRIRTGAVKFFDGKSSPEKLFPRGLFAGEAPEASVDEDTELFLETDLCLNWKLSCAAGGNVDDNDLLRAVLEINPDFLPDYSPSVVALNQSVVAALHLMENGDIAPQIVRLKDSSYAVRWIPCTVDPEVSRILESLDALIPDSLIRVRAGKQKKSVAAKAETLLSYIFGKLVPVFTSAANRALADLFFDGGHHDFDSPGEREIPGGICAWLSSYSLRKSRFTPVFVVDEASDELFEMNISVEDEESRGVVDAVPLSEVFSDGRFDASRIEILRAFTDLSTVVPDVSIYVAGKGQIPMRYSASDFGPLLMRVIPAVKLLGVKVVLPKSLECLIRPKPTLKLKRRNGHTHAGIGLDGLFDFEWEIALGDEVVPAAEFRKLLGHAGRLLKFKGSYIFTSPDDLEKVNKAIAGTSEVTSGELLQAAVLGEYDSAPVLMDDDIRALIRKFTSEEEIPVPAGLQAELRPYQTRGYSWLYRNMRVGFGSILADDMGLGKTLQTIALLEKLREDGMLWEKRALIVVPTGLLSNWQAEISRFAPGLTSFIYHGPGRTLPETLPDVLLTTYGVLRSDAKILSKKKWAVAVIDEAQNIKNSSTAQSKAVKAVPADTRIALSGTPVENRLSEFWSIMDFTNRGYLGTLKSFGEKYAVPIQLYNDEDCAARFRKVTSPFMMRRMKTDRSIISDLPDKIEQNEYSSLTAGQAALYRKTLDEAMAVIEGIDTRDKTALFVRQGLILQMILALKQICNHPSQYLKDGDLRPELSGKVEMLLDRLDAIVDAGEKVLVFTQFREMGDMLVKFVGERLGKTPMFYHGGCNVKQRNEMVHRFQNNREDKIFILSLKAAGTGLNLTAASHVIHFDLWWNPAVEAQATDRAYRIGQNRNVMVHRFITRDTFEERIDDMIQKKKHLAQMTVATGENWIGKLSNSELHEIFG